MGAHDNPYPKADADRWELWETLVRCDNEAFVAASWEMIAENFVANGFAVTDAHGTIDTSTWTVAFSDLDAYARVWRHKAQEYRRTLGPDQVHALMRDHNRLARIDVVGDVAIVEKTIGGLLWGDSIGQPARATTTLCHGRRVNGRWRIVSILSRLPVDSHRSGRQSDQSVATLSFAEPRFASAAAIR